MKLTQKEYQSIIESCPEGRLLAAWMVEQTEKIVSIKNLAKDLESEEKSEDARHRQVVEYLHRRRKDIQKKCEHLLKTHHQDPSGNNDSYNTCDICKANC